MVLLSYNTVKTFKRPSLVFTKALQKHLQEFLERFGKGHYQVSLLFCDDAFIQNLNSHYRQKDYATDVLAFSQDEGEEIVSNVACIGDIIVSAQTAQRQAETHQISYEEELARLSIHGLLHLLGYDHEKGPEAESEMLAMQDELMDVFMKSYAGIESHGV